MDVSPSLLLVTLSVIVIASLTALGKRRRQRLPPGPFAWPVVGNFPALLGGLPHRVLRDLALKYGGLMYLRLGSVPTLVVSTVAESRALFQTRDTVFLVRPKGLAMEILSHDYKTMGWAKGRHWRELRKVCAMELFAPKRLAIYGAGRDQEVHHMIGVLLEHARSRRPVDLKRWLTAVTSNNMTRMLLNKRYFGEGAESKHEQEEFALVLSCASDLLGAFIVSDFVPYLGVVTWLQGWRRKLEAQRDFLFDIGVRMLEIERHRQRTGDEDYVPDFVDVLLETPVESGRPLSDPHLTLMIMDLVLGGTETIATSVEWAMAELVRRPEVMRRLRDEVDGVVGADRAVSEADIAELPFLQAVVKENLRLHSPLPLNLPRESETPFEFRGYQFPARTRLILNFAAIHRDPEVYEDPDEFRPERFLGRPEVSAVAAFEWFELTPFSAGRRICPAASLGNTMVSLVLAHLVHGFDWEVPVGEGVDMAEQFGLTVSMKAPLRLVPRARLPAAVYRS